MSGFNAETVGEVTAKLQKASENSTKMYESGVAAGKKSEYDAFWDRFQSNGKKVFYDNVFPRQVMARIVGYTVKPTTQNILFSLSPL